MKEKLKNLLIPDDNSVSVSLSIIKILLGVLLLLLSFFRPTIGIITVEVMARIIATFLTVFSAIFLIFLPVLDLAFFSIERVTEQQDCMCTDLPVEFIEKMIADHDIIEFELLYNSKQISFGASSCSNSGESGFHDKAYYIGKNEISDYSMFKNALEYYAVGGALKICTMDGIDIRKQLTDKTKAMIAAIKTDTGRDSEIASGMHKDE